MARSARTDFAKVKIWMPNMTSEVEGTIAGVAIEVFGAISKRAVRFAALMAMRKRHDELCEREDARFEAATPDTEE